MRYGTPPVVRATGGLVDTVTKDDEARGSGTGFVFHDLNPQSLADTIGWAVSTWYDRPAHIEVMRHRAMREDHSGDQAARGYAQLYLMAYARRRGHDFLWVASAERRDTAGRGPGRNFGSCFGEEEERGGPGEQFHAPAIPASFNAEIRPT